jgi:hypothetical protein
MKLTYTNAKGRSITFAAPDGYRSAEYCVTGLDGVHGLESQLQTIEQYPADGETFVGARVHARDITIQGIIYERRKDEAGRPIMGKAAPRIALLEAIRPKEMGTLTATRDNGFKRRIQCVPERAPFFNRARGDMFTIQLRCPQPYWLNGDGDVKREFNSWDGLFEFPLEIPGGELGTPLWQRRQDNPPIGIEFGRRATTHTMNAVNNGDAETGFTARMKAIGEIENPRLVKLITQERLSFALTLNAGDELTLSTQPFDKWARLTRADGTIENAMKYINLDFTFFTLDPGDNSLRATADSGGELLEASVSFSEKFLGL